MSSAAAYPRSGALQAAAGEEGRPSLAQAARAAEQAAERRRIIALLHKWGIHTLGQLAALQKEDISLRLGPEGVRMWERASGKATRLLQFVQPPESFVETYEFEAEIETVEPLHFILRRFLETLTHRLSALYFVARELRLEITFSNRQTYAHRFKIPEPSNQVEALFRMLQTHLENFSSPSPIVAVALEATPAKPGLQQFSLFETALRDPTRLSETLARLVGLLGSDRVGTPVLQDSHRPDDFRMEAFAWEFSEEPVELPSLPGHALRRLRARVSRLRPDEIHRRKGPYLASGNWWDENAWSRREWDGQGRGGALLRCHEDTDGWQVDGIYD